MPSRLWEFLIGGLLVFLAQNTLTRKAGELIAVSGLALIFVPAMLFTTLTPFPGLNALYPCLGTALTIYGCRTAQNSGIDRGLSNAVVSLIGKASYSIYLVHWPLLVLAKYRHVTDLSLGWRLMLGVSSNLIGLVSWRYVERPFRLPGPSLGRRSIIRIAVVLTIVILIGGAGVLTRGFPDRFSNKTLSLAAAAQDQGSFRHCLDPNSDGPTEFCRLGQM